MQINTDEDEEKEEEHGKSELKLYKCTDEGGTYRIFEIKSGRISNSDLTSNVSIGQLKL